MKHLAVIVMAIALMPFARSAEPVVLNLWPGKPPGEAKDLPREALQPPRTADDKIARLANVSIPTLTVYKAAKPTGQAVLVAPGGGYSILAIEHEGTKVCEWLNSIGTTAVLLKYRVPKRPGQSPENLAAFQDGQRAMSLVRSKAAEWGIDPKRIGMLGFSAGGHLTASVALDGQRLYDPVDDADKQSCQPNFNVLIYPGGVTDNSTGQLKKEFVISKNYPPTFFVHATDDRCENSVELYRALKAAKVPAEMHLYASGGHGFGINPVPHACATWPARCADWLKGR